MSPLLNAKQDHHHPLLEEVYLKMCAFVCIILYCICILCVYICMLCMHLCVVHVYIVHFCACVWCVQQFNPTYIVMLQTTFASSQDSKTDNDPPHYSKTTLCSCPKLCFILWELHRFIVSLDKLYNPAK